jgi:hypothetical protein
MKKLIVLMLLCYGMASSQVLFYENKLWRDSLGVLVPKKLGQSISVGALTAPSIVPSGTSGQFGWWKRNATAPESGTLTAATVSDTLAMKVAFFGKGFNAGLLSFAVQNFAGTNVATIDTTGAITSGSITATSADAPVLTSNRSTSVTNALRTAGRFLHTTSGTIADNFGTTLSLSIRSGTGTIYDIGHLNVQRIGADGTGRMYFGVNSGNNAGLFLDYDVGSPRVTVGSTAGTGDGKLYLGDSLYHATTLVMDGSRNFVNIGTIGSGAITSTGTVSGTAFSANSGPVTTSVASFTGTNAKANILELYRSASGTAVATVDTNGAITSGADGDITTILGRTRIDSRTSDRLYLSHYDLTGSGDYALRQLSNGETSLNSSSGQNVYLKVNNVVMGQYYVTNGRPTYTMGTTQGVGGGQAYIGDSLYIGTTLALDASRNASLGTISSGAITSTGTSAFHTVNIGQSQNSTLTPFAVKNFAGTNVITGDTLGNVAGLYGDWSDNAYGAVYITSATPDSITVSATDVFYTVGAKQGANGYAWTSGGVLQNVTVQDSSITVQKTGKYHVTYTLNVSSLNMGGGSRLNAFIYVNDVQQVKTELLRWLSGTNDYGNATGTTILSLTANDIIKVKVRSLDDGAGTFIVWAANLAAERID